MMIGDVGKKETVQLEMKNWTAPRKYASKENLR